MGEAASPQILHDPAYGWDTTRVDGSEALLKGAFWHENELYSGERGCEKIHTLFSGLGDMGSPARLEAVRHVLSGLDGNFAFILQSKNFVLACVDHVRSFPLFYSTTGGCLRLSCSAPRLRAEAGLGETSENAELEFLMSGYVSGRNTLFSGLYQVRPGELLLHSRQDDNLVLEQYCTFFSNNLRTESEESLLHELGVRHERSLTKMLRALDGRQACVPLSGGLDSRLILGFLAEQKYDNILAFTYGVKGLWEASVAKAVAEKAGVEWLRIEYRPDQVKKHTYSQEGLDYIRFASGLGSLPFVSENYALAELQAQGKLQADRVLINGQSGDFTSGGHAPVWLLSDGGGEMNTTALLDFAVDRHYSLWRDLKTKRNLKTIREILSVAVGLEEGTALSGEDFIKRYELFEWRERQSKYVVNGQRLYDWLGYDWLLPLWDMELFTFWRELPWKYKAGQNLYKKYLQERNPGGLLSIESPGAGRNDIPAAFLPPQVLYQLVAKTLRLDRDWFKRTFINYYWVAAPFYPQRSYLEFLKDSGKHRNFLSYLTRMALKVLRDV